MKIRFTYDLGDGPQEITVGPAAIIGYEIANKTKISKIASDGLGVVDMSDLVWRQLKADGGTGQSLDAFRAGLIDIDPVLTENPT